MEQISNSRKLLDFKQYLDTVPRIILSAKFGDGKTTFLKEVKALSNQSVKGKVKFDDYQFFTIYPVNYVVARNEDIFEYVKRDIFLQLHELELLDKIDLNAVFDTILNIKDIQSIFSFLFSFVPGGAFYDKFMDLASRKLDEYNNKKNTFEKYIKTFQEQHGSIYEEDGYTRIIREALNIIKKGEFSHPQKKTVLVIEDLDRLDPGHLFRILNIISAHIDQTESDNKFGFDNIVLVMDYETTRHVFEHFYGKQANFEGYMSKFLSSAPFHYSVKELAFDQIRNKLNKDLELKIYDYMPNLINHLNTLSMRDLCKFLDFDYHNRITCSDISICEMSFATDLYLFRLIIDLVALGLTKKEIISDITHISTKLSSKEMALLLYPLFCFEDNKKYDYCEINHNIYIKPEFETDVKGVIVRIKSELYSSFISNKTRFLKAVSKSAISEFLDKAQICLNLSCVKCDLINSMEERE